MGAANVVDPFALYLVAAAKNNMAKMMRERVPQGFVVTVLAESTEVFMRVACVPVNGVVVRPCHGFGSRARRCFGLCHGRNSRMRAAGTTSRISPE
jgi:hypothetical protein